MVRKLYKLFYQYGIFLLVPGFVLGFSILFKMAAGPYWLDPNIEGPYATLSNGLDLLKGNVPDDTTHPATPTQLLSCVIFRLFNMGRSTEDTITHVLTRPEFYLHIVFLVLALFSFFTSISLAAYVYRKTNDQLAALLTQLPALSFLVIRIYSTPDPVIPIIANVGSEHLLIGIVNLFTICLLMNFFAKTGVQESISILWWGLVCGWGAAEKLTFIPLLLVPFIILSWKNRIFFICAFAASFVAWTLPIISKYPLLWGMVKKYLNLGGAHGSAQAGIDGIRIFYLNWKDIIIEYWMFAGVLFAAVLYLLWKFVGKKWDKALLFLLAISLGVLIQFSTVAKHPGSQYIMPGLGLFSSLLAVFYLQGRGLKVLGRRITGGFILVFILLGVWQAIVYRSNLEKLTKDIVTFNNDVHAKYQGCVFVNYYRSTGQEFALYLGDAWQGSPQLMKEKDLLYPNSFFLTGWGDRIMSFRGRVLSDDLLAQSSCVLFQGDGLLGDLDQILKGSPLTVSLLEKGRMERIYRLTGTTEKQAVISFMGAAYSFQAGNYAQSLAFANQAKAFHYQPASDVETFINFLTLHMQGKT